MSEINKNEYQSEIIWVNITNDSLPLETISNWCTSSRSGATINFVGTTRDFFEDKSVDYLEYESYIEMACEECKHICEEALEKFPGTIKATIHHRLGRVDIGETSIICSISSEHRKEGFEACEWMMKDLKARVPIWKKEVWKEGQAVWKENKEYNEEHQK